GIVHLWNLDAPPGEKLGTAQLEAALEGGLHSIVSLVQAWDRALPDRSARLFLVTRGAHSVGDQGESAAIAQGPTGGLGRVIAGEHPRLHAKLVDLDPGADDGGVTSLLRELQSTDLEDEVAWRGPERYIHRFVAAGGVEREGEKAAARAGGPYRLLVR